MGAGLPGVYVEGTISATTLAPSGNPLVELLSTREALVFLARARGLAITQVAAALGVSLKTAYRDLAHARAVLTPLVPR